jgi:hypothetical protein
VTFEIRGALRALFVAWIVAWPCQGLAQPAYEASQPFHEESAEVPEEYRAHLAPFSFGGLTLSKRGVEYRTAFLVKRREFPFRVWGGRMRKQPALGIDFEPVMRNGKLRVGAYGTIEEFGFAIRVRY